MKGYDIIVQAGQSNAQGYGYGDTETEFVPTEDILYYCDADFEKFDDRKYCSNGEGFEIVLAKEQEFFGYKRSNFSLYFADEYKKSGLLKEGRKILIIRCAIGGTSFSRKDWRKTDDLFLRMLKAIENAKKLRYGDNDHRFVGLLWHQGESDAEAGVSKKTYYDQLKYLVEKVRESTDEVCLPFLAGDFVQDWKNSSVDFFNGCVPIVEALKCLTVDLDRSGFVESDGLLSNRLNPSCPDLSEVREDNIHFCREAQRILGIRYFEKYKNILQSD